MTRLRDIRSVSLAAGPRRARRRLWHCRACDALMGAFGDYVWACDRSAARQAFLAKHGLRPATVEVER